MALSEEEQHLLDDMERALIRDDPTFAANVSFRHVRRERFALRAAVFVLGTIVLMAGLVGTSLSVLVGAIISVAGVLTMTAAVTTRRASRPTRQS